MCIATFAVLLFGVAVLHRFASREAVVADGLAQLVAAERARLNSSLSQSGLSHIDWVSLRGRAAYTPVLIPVSGRPQYLRRVLASLRRANGVGQGRSVLVFGIHGHDRGVLDLIDEAEAWTAVVRLRPPLPAEAWLLTRFKRDDAPVASNIAFLLSFALDRAGFADAIVLESDVAVGQDAYSFFRWASRLLRMASRPRGPSGGAMRSGPQRDQQANASLRADRVLAVNGFHGLHYAHPPEPARRVVVDYGRACEAEVACSSVSIACDGAATVRVDGLGASVGGYDFSSWGWLITRQAWSRELGSTIAWRNWDLSLEATRASRGLVVVTPDLSRSRHIGLTGNNFGGDLDRPREDSGSAWYTLPVLDKEVEGKGCSPSGAPVFYRFPRQPGGGPMPWAAPRGQPGPGGAAADVDELEASGSVLDDLVAAGRVVAEPLRIGPSIRAGGSSSLRDRLWRGLPPNLPGWLAQ